MDINSRINNYFQNYKSYMEAARIAEKKGNIEGARKLYLSAANALCDMAELESGETKRSRVLHAEEVMKKAESLGTTRVSSVPEKKIQEKPTQNKREAPAAPVSKQNTTEDNDDNPWKSEGIPTTSFDDVVGMEDVKKLVRERIIGKILHPELYDQYRIEGGTGILLFGLPGTGKTTIARAIAHELNAPLYLVYPSAVKDKYVGESEKKVKLLFDKARSTPVSIIFFDDIDTIGVDRKDDVNHNNSIIGEMINQMDGYNKNENTILLLAATNRPWAIDSALMRGRRFEHHLYVPLPNHEARAALIQKSIKDVPVDPDLDVDKISDLMAGYNGSDIVTVVMSVKVAAVNRTLENMNKGENEQSPITFDDFTDAIANHQSSVNPKDITQMRKYAEEMNIQLPDEM